MGAVVEESECTSATGGIVNNLRHHWSVSIKEEFVANTNLACRFYQYVPEAELCIQFPQQEHLYLGVGFLLCTIKACRKYRSVVEYKSIAFVEVFDGITECHEYTITISTFYLLAVFVSLVHLNLLTLAVEHHQSTFITAVNLVNRTVVIRKCLVGWLKGHLIFRQIKTKF